MSCDPFLSRLTRQRSRSATSKIKSVSKWAKRSIFYELGRSSPSGLMRAEASKNRSPFSVSPRGKPGREGSPHAAKTARLPPQEGFQDRFAEIPLVHPPERAQFHRHTPRC